MEPQDGKTLGLVCDLQKSSPPQLKARLWDTGKQMLRLGSGDETCQELAWETEEPRQPWDRVWMLTQWITWPQYFHLLGFPFSLKRPDQITPVYHVWLIPSPSSSPLLRLSLTHCCKIPVLRLTLTN
jgi:hypothetical protein